MGTALAVFHGRFGRASLYRLNKPLARHAHREGHLIFLIEGAPARVEIAGTEHELNPGTVIAVSPWQPHDFRPADLGRGAVFLTLYITPRWFLDLSRGTDVMRFGSSVIERGSVIRTLDRSVTAMLGDGQTGARFPALLHDLTAACYDESWAVGRTVGSSLFPRITDYRIRNAVRLMNERVTDTCVLDRVARDAGLSRPHFYKLFRQNVGLTPNLYLNTLRLERSIERLTRSGDPVTSIGLDLGFASQASFTRFFSNNIGIAPTDYRRVSYVAA